MSKIEIYSPLDYEVFQRENKTTGHIFVQGSVSSDVKKLQIKISGKDMYGNPINMDWCDFDINPDYSFGESIDMYSGGWYKVEFRDELGDYVSVDHVGIGEVIMGAGQSNASCHGDTRLKTETGMVASFDGEKWHLAEDPFMGGHDLADGCNADKGSFYCPMGDALYEEFKVPIGVTTVAYGASRVEMWEEFHKPIAWSDEEGKNVDIESGINLYDYMINRMNKLGRRGFRCVVWHQGENDSSDNTQSHVYYEKLAEIIIRSQHSAGWYVPWFVAIASYSSEKVNYNVRDGQKRLSDDKIAYLGPDTDKLIGDYRAEDHVHFSEKGLKEHGKMWAECVKAYIHKIIDY